MLDIQERHLARPLKTFDPFFTEKAIVKNQILDFDQFLSEVRYCHQQKELVSLCNMIQPVCNVISEPVEVDGKMVLLLWVPGGDARPYKAPVSLSKDDKKRGKRYYVRQGSVTRIANEREEQQLMQLANKIPYDDRLCHAAQVDDLSPLLVKDYLRCITSRGMRGRPLKSIFIPTASRCSTWRVRCHR
jgi:predicted HTH transcriptional regulator